MVSQPLAPLAVMIAQAEALPPPNLSAEAVRAVLEHHRVQRLPVVVPNRDRHAASGNVSWIGGGGRCSGGRSMARWNSGGGTRCEST